MAQSSDSARNRLQSVLSHLRNAKADFSQELNDAQLSSLREQGVLITGGASGLGAAFATALAKQGAFITVADFDNERGTSIVADFQSKGWNAQFVECNVTSWASQKVAFEAAVAFGPQGLNHVIANAGVRGFSLTMADFKRDPKQEEPPDPQTTAIETTLIGSYYTTLLAAHYLSNRTPSASSTAESLSAPSNVRKSVSVDRSITFLGSFSSYRVNIWGPDYSAAKFGVRGLFKSVRTPFRMFGVRVNMLAPQYIETDMTRKYRKGIEKNGYRFADIEDAKRAVLMILSDRNITGRSIGVTVDGIFDLGDDIEGHDAWPLMEKLLHSGALPAQDD